MEERKFKAVRVKHRETGEETIVCNVCAKDHNIVGDVVLITNEPSTVECAECHATVQKVISSPAMPDERVEVSEVTQTLPDLAQPIENPKPESAEE